MADVSSNFYDWSTTAASNLPSGATTIGTGLDDNLREIQAVVRSALGSLGANIASASTMDIGAVPGYRHFITGTTTVNSLGTVDAGICKVLVFGDTLTLTHNGTSLILPGAANITTTVQDMAGFQSEGSGNWRCLWYTKATGRPVKELARAYAEYLSNTDISTAIPADDTIPQSGEGTEILSVTITPKTATNRIRIRFMGFGTMSTQGVITAAAFNGGTDCVGASLHSIEATGFIRPIVLECEYLPGTTATQTVSIRVGPNTGTMRLNGNMTGRLFGGRMVTSLVVEEVPA